jgi:hypothetical protein
MVSEDPGGEDSWTETHRLQRSQQNFIESEKEWVKAGEYTPQGSGWRVGSEQSGLRAAPVAQEHQGIGLDGYL